MIACKFKQKSPMTLIAHEGQALQEQRNLFCIYSPIEIPVGNSLLSQDGLHSSVLHLHPSSLSLP